jgi:cytoskeletal protein CcmA (bactofilin family)
MQVEGDFHYSGAVDVAGLINGNVYGKEMIIFDTGSVKGNLHVSKLDINGHVEGKIIADEISLGSNSVVKGDILFKSYLKTEQGAEIDGYIKGNKTKKVMQDEEDKDIEEIKARPELGKPTLVKDNKKEAI